MSILLDRTTWLPVGGRKYTDPATGVSVVGETADRIIEQIVRERTLRNMPSSGVQSEVEEYICSKFPHLCGRTGESSKISHKFGPKDVVAFLSAVSGTIKSGGVVEQGVAESRADICLQCPYNTRIGGCEGCNGVSNTVFSIIGAKRVRNMGNLKNCGICGCSLKAKIWVPDDVLGKTAQIQQNEGDFPSWCWVAKK